ncbi:MAG TPA: hypothetical protein VFB56_02395, partial [Nitrospiraceae bacterium]|nr:hypothetical protein [Nitrospiraceae bacterium]
MQVYRKLVFVFIAALTAAAGWGYLAAAQNRGQAPTESVIKETGQSVTGAYEGWYRNSDGTATMLVGYFNRNSKETFDIPLGPNNRIDPGGPDQGQPT